MKIEKVLICGGRDFTDWIAFRTAMHRIAERLFQRTPPDEKYGNYLYAVTVISGGATGADKLAAEWAIVNWTGLRTYKADWDKYGKAAGPIRNQQMLDEEKPELVIAFPGGKGTAHMRRIAKEAGVPVVMVKEDGVILYPRGM